MPDAKGEPISLIGHEPDYGLQLSVTLAVIAILIFSLIFLYRTQKSSLFQKPLWFWIIHGLLVLFTLTYREFQLAETYGTVVQSSGVDPFEIAAILEVIHQDTTLRLFITFVSCLLGLLMIRFISKRQR